MITATPESFRLARIFTISRGSKTHAQVVSCQISRGGHVGRGECVPYARYGESLESVLEAIRALPADISRADLQEALPAGAARNAVDCALWDLEAKTLGRPVWQLAGLPAPAPVTTAFTLSLAEPAEMEEQARAHATRPILKIKLGTPDDMPRLEAVRRGAPRPQLVVDANEGWSLADYRALAPHLARLGVVLVEQPLAAGADHALDGQPRPIALCADESCHDLASLPGLRGRYDMINIKLDKTGGLTEALRLREAALAEGMGVMIGCMVGTSLAMAPAMLLCAGAALADLDGSLLLAEDREHPLVAHGSVLEPASRQLWG